MNAKEFHDLLTELASLVSVADTKLLAAQPDHGVAAVETAVYDTQHGVYRYQDDIEPSIRSKCLCCQRTFDAANKFIRLCRACREDNAHVIAMECSSPTLGYTSNVAALSRRSVGGDLGVRITTHFSCTRSVRRAP